MNGVTLKGFTIIEVMAVMIIGLILVGFAGLGANKAIQNAKLDQTAVAIRITAGELDMYITEHGAPYPTGNMSMDEIARTFVDVFNSDYASMSLDTGTLTVNGNSFTIETLAKTDAWRKKYLLYYSSDKAMFIIASAGPNGEFDFLTNTDMSFVDDLLAAIIAKQ